MIRETLLKKERAVRNGFRLRGLDSVSRVEALSDGASPSTYAARRLAGSAANVRRALATMRGFLAFAITFAMLFHVWLTQYKFFRRYGLNDNFTIWMTALLLFVVLFYVYPLKFVWTLHGQRRPRLRGDGRDRRRAASSRLCAPQQMRTLLFVYGPTSPPSSPSSRCLHWHATASAESSSATTRTLRHRSLFQRTRSCPPRLLSAASPSRHAHQSSSPASPTAHRPRPIPPRPPHGQAPQAAPTACSI